MFSQCAFSNVLSFFLSLWDALVVLEACYFFPPTQSKDVSIFPIVCHAAKWQLHSAVHFTTNPNWKMIAILISLDHSQSVSEVAGYIFSWARQQQNESWISLALPKDCIITALIWDWTTISHLVLTMHLKVLKPAVHTYSFVDHDIPQGPISGLHLFFL